MSINVQISCNSAQKITNVVARWPGSTHDARVFNNSNLCQILEDGQYDGHLLGDQGYGCLRYLMTPLGNPQTQAEQRYNLAHTRTRTAIERLFGRWKRRFPCLRMELRFTPEKCAIVIVACSVLHNFAIDQNEVPFDDEVDEEANEIYNAQGLNQDIRGTVKRQLIIQNHFA